MGVFRFLRVFFSSLPLHVFCWLRSNDEETWEVQSFWIWKQPWSWNSTESEVKCGRKVHCSWSDVLMWVRLCVCMLLLKQANFFGSKHRQTHSYKSYRAGLHASICLYSSVLLHHHFICQQGWLLTLSRTCYLMTLL